MASRDQRRSGVCRIADWARAKGIDDQDGKKLDNEAIDVEYVAMASYFDELSADDKRNLRNDDNLRRLLALAPNVLEMREPEAGQIADAGAAPWRWHLDIHSIVEEPPVVALPVAPSPGVPRSVLAGMKTRSHHPAKAVKRRPAKKVAKRSRAARGDDALAVGRALMRKPKVNTALLAIMKRNRDLFSL